MQNITHVLKPPVYTTKSGHLFYVIKLIKPIIKKAIKYDEKRNKNHSEDIKRVFFYLILLFFLIVRISEVVPGQAFHLYFLSFSRQPLASSVSLKSKTTSNQP